MASPAVAGYYQRLSPRLATETTAGQRFPGVIINWKSIQGHRTLATVFGDFDISDFWEKSEYARKEYEGRPLDDATVRAVERELGYKLPASYVEFMKLQNGGIPRCKNHRAKEPTSWARDHIAVLGIFSVGREAKYSLCGEFKSQFWIDEWGYPPIGVYFADCPSGGHDMVCLDYSKCGPAGEPRIVHIDQELDYRVVVLAERFELFIRGLEDDSAFEV